MSTPGTRVERRGRRGIGALAGAILVLAAGLTPGCYTVQLGLLRSGLDSLRTQVDTLTIRDSVAYLVVADTRRELAAQREVLLSTRATSGSTMQEMFDQMGRLEGKLDDVMHRFSDFSARTTSGGPSSSQGPVTVNGSPASPGAPAAGTVSPGGGPTAPQLYDQATRDLTEGRYPLALRAYRELLSRYPSVDLAAGAQYGVGECFFAEAAFDSAAVEYAKVSERWPKGDRTPAALYKLGLCQDRLGRAADARKTFEDLVRRFPAASEAALARERIGATRH